MSKPAPTDDVLTRFLLGTLPASQLDEVEPWLSDPDVIARLPRLNLRDPLLAELPKASSFEAPPLEQMNRIRSAVGRSYFDETSNRGPDTAAGVVASPSIANALSSIAPYRILREIGRGGMGVVLEAYDENLARVVALKVMNPAVANNPRAKARFLREAQAIAAIQHDHVVPIYHVGEQDGTPFLVMPLLNGEPLDNRLRAGALPLSQVIQIGREVAEGLAAAHSAGIVHRDIKPGNIWLERLAVPATPAAAHEETASFSGSGLAFRVRLLDFGLARISNTEAITESGTVLGTAAYMAPEQADGKDADARADLFSLGAVLYQCATGQRAFSGDSFLATLKALSTHKPLPPHKMNAAIPRELSELIMRLLAKEPAERPANARDVATQLNRLGSSPAVTSHTTRTSRRWIGGAIAATVLLAVSVWGIAYFATHSDTKNKLPDVTNPSVPPTGEPPVQPSPTTAKYQGTVDILVHGVDDDGSEKLFPLWDPRAMPLRSGTSIRIEATLEPRAYIYLFWIDEAGRGAPVYPWALGNWGTRPTDEKPMSYVDIRSPNGKAPRISGEGAGMETILMIARPTPLTLSDEQIKGWFVGLKPLAFRGEKARVWFEGFDLLRTDQKRGVSYDGDAAADDSPMGLQETLRARIGTNAPFSRAISFARVGSKTGGK